MSEKIYKLQPDRTLALRGFDGLGASAALHSATPNSFVVSGTFRDTADFAVLILHDADNFYEHPRFKYLPDFSFDGLTLTFDVSYSGLMALDSPMYNTIGWPHLNAIRKDGSSRTVRLLPAKPVYVGAPPAKATCKFTIVDNGMQKYDRIILWYCNAAFDSFDGTIDPVTAPEMAQILATAINRYDYEKAGISNPLTATADGPDINITTTIGGDDGNLLSMYAHSKNERMRTTEEVVKFSGGSSNATWRVSLDFSQLDLKEVRLMWLTFAPKLADGAAYRDTEWEAKFSNWTLTGPEGTRRLRVAGPGSVRIEENNPWCTYTGSWDLVGSRPEVPALNEGFYSEGYAKKAVTAGSKVRIRYACSLPHELYVGTRLFRGAGSVSVTLDGAALDPLDCELKSPPDTSEAPVVTRRVLSSKTKRPGELIPAGEHVVELTAFAGFRFDFLEAAVPGDVPEPLPPDTRVSPALDYSTDHTYKLSPARVHWNFDQLGFAAPMNEYIGVFWWNQRKRVGASIPRAEVSFTGTFSDKDKIFLNFGSGDAKLKLGKDVRPADTNATIARHFAMYINGTSVVAWAEASENKVRITARSPKRNYRVPLAAETTSTTGSVRVEGRLDEGSQLEEAELTGTWEIDPTQTPALNRGTRDWHADMFRECKKRNRQIVVAQSMELINPPEGYGAMYLDGEVVETAITFGNLTSTHCHFGPQVREYQIAVLKNVAGLMTEAGLTPELQLGEFLWWFFTNYGSKNTKGGMAYYDEDTKKDAKAALGPRGLAEFRTPDDDPTVNGGADMRFLRSRLNAHTSAIMSAVRAAYPNAKFELLFPYDVNYPKPTGVHKLGGKLNSSVNLPPEWHNHQSSGFDRIKTEALDFGAWCRDLDLSTETIELPRKLGWERDQIRHLVPIFQPGYAWDKQVAIALRECPVVNLWAWDHICLYGLTITPKTQGRSTLMAA